MWIQRDLLQFLPSERTSTLPVKVLRGPRQVGKTSLLDHKHTHQLVLFDDLGIRTLAETNPALFFEQFPGPLILDEATLAPHIFPEIKKRVDEERRRHRETGEPMKMDIWITGSNQTLLHKAVRESLTGRANYYFLNTLSLHELNAAFSQECSLSTIFMRGGWPELHASPDLNAVHYLNDFVATFIEKDIVAAAGIEKRAAFSKALQLAAGRVGQLFNASDIAKNIGVDTTTVQSWMALFEQNGVIRILPPYYANHNQRLIKSPKIFFEDVGLAVRLQGWSAFEPILPSPYFGSLLENLALSEIIRFFTNRTEQPAVYFVRSKEQVEVDFLLQLPNQRFIAVEAKATPSDFTTEQMRLLRSLKLQIVDHWVVSPVRSHDFAHARVVLLKDIYEALDGIK